MVDQSLGKQPNQNSPSALAMNGGSDSPRSGADSSVRGADTTSDTARRGGGSLVDEMNREHRRNPGAADAPPQPEPPSGPAWAEHDEHDTDSKGVRKVLTDGVKGFFAAAPKEGQAPKSKAQRDRMIKQRRRKQRAGLRYKGDRKKWLWFELGLVAITVISVAGLLVGLSRPTTADMKAAVTKEVATSGKAFPEGQAVMWAGQVLRVWGTWDEDKVDTRKVQIAPYLSSGMDEQAGWDGTGKQDVIFESINPQPQVLDAHHAVVTGTYQVQDGSWHCVDLPMFAYHPSGTSGQASWAFALSGDPTPVGCAPRTGAPSDDTNAGKVTADDDLGRELAKTVFPGFFAAWAASDEDTLNQYTASGVKLLGLGGSMSSTPAPRIGDTTVLIPGVNQKGPQSNVTYTAVVPVTWTVAGGDAQVTATYDVRVRREGDRWKVVSEPTASTHTAPGMSGAPAGVPQPQGGESQAPTYPNAQPTPSTPPSSGPGSPKPSPSSTSKPKSSKHKPSKKASAKSSATTKHKASTKGAK